LAQSFASQLRYYRPPGYLLSLTIPATDQPFDSWAAQAAMARASMVAAEAKAVVNMAAVKAVAVKPATAKGSSSLGGVPSQILRSGAL